MHLMSFHVFFKFKLSLSLAIYLDLFNPFSQLCKNIMLDKILNFSKQVFQQTFNIIFPPSQGKSPQLTFVVKLTVFKINYWTYIYILDFILRWLLNTSKCFFLSNDFLGLFTMRSELVLLFCTQYNELSCIRICINELCFACTIFLL